MNIVSYDHSFVNAKCMIHVRDFAYCTPLPHVVHIMAATWYENIRAVQRSY